MLSESLSFSNSLSNYTFNFNVSDNLSLTQRIASFVKETFKFIFKAICYVVHPTLFGLGIVAGVIWSESIQHAIDKILMVWKNQNLPTKVLMYFFTLQSLPAFFITSSVLSGGSIGRKLYNNAIHFRG